MHHEDERMERREPDRSQQDTAGLLASLNEACKELQHLAGPGVAYARDWEPRLVAVRTEAHRFARLARQSGMPPERMLVELKECLRESEMRRLDEAARGWLQERLTTWAIQGYYRAD